MRALPLLLLAGCELGETCTHIGCDSSVHFDVETAGEPVGTYHGEVTVGGTRFSVDCGGEVAPGAEITCEDGGFTLHLGAVEGGGEVEWVLNGPSTSGGALTGGGTFTPDWSTSQPNGPGCDPTCFSADATLELFEAP